jgi:hypothetical protein
MYLVRKEEALRAKRGKDMYKQGMQFYTDQDFVKAAENFTLAIGLQANVARYYFARGNCFRCMKEYQRCVFDYSMAIRADDHVAVYYGLC